MNGARPAVDENGDPRAFLRAAAVDKELSLEGFLVALAERFDAYEADLVFWVRPPSEETAFRRAFLRNQLGEGSRLKKLRRAIAKGERRGETALRQLALTWAELRDAQS